MPNTHAPIIELNQSSRSPKSTARSKTPEPPHLRMPDAKARKRVYACWDKLADFNTARVDEALTFLLQSLCALVGAQNADWIGVVRLSDIQPGDPVNGWRPPVVHFLHPNERFSNTIKEKSRNLAHGLVNDVVIRFVAMSGRFRACRLRDLEPPEWFDNAFYREHYQACGHDDAIYVAFPVNDDTESYFGIFRASGHPPFTPAERNTLAYALRGIKWFHRQLLLSHGLTIAAAPLTPLERKVLQGLLGGLAEKQIAADLGHSYHTTHEYVINIFRKFGVTNRAALTSLWLGRMP